ncbi:hypothetical protein HDV02_001400 [Globomyces sp. JEL0801]|nr:hypothetical protein HDV02_001400 [Globomyces sp. JEL0801]
MRFSGIINSVGLGIRTKTSLIPPNISSLREIGKLTSKYPQAHPELFATMKNFYKAVPKGNAVKQSPKGLWDAYYYRYIETSSPVPLLHFLFVMVPTGYYISYFVNENSVI